MPTVYDFQAQQIAGQPVDLSQNKGQVRKMGTQAAGCTGHKHGLAGQGKGGS